MSDVILIAGRNGQVASALQEQILPGTDIVCLGRSDLDLTRPETLAAAFEKHAPRLVINAAAYTAVDQAETDREGAFALNATGAGALATEAAKRDIPILHLSTDYVYDGAKSAPYKEEDATAPLGVYGQSKLEGERLVAAANRQHLILRTAWVYSPFGKNFAKTMLRVAQQRPELGVVDDQIGNPTSAHDIASALIRLASNIFQAPTVPWGVYHLTASGEASWADFAEEIFAASRAHGGPVDHVKRISTAEYPTPTRRPANSRLDCAKLEAAFGIRLPHWKDSTRACIARLVAEKAWAP